MEQQITINYLGQFYNFKTDITDVSAVKASEMVSEVLTRTCSDSVAPVNEKEKIALLLSVALSIASENVRLQSANMAMVQRITKLTEDLIKRIDAK